VYIINTPRSDEYEDKTIDKLRRGRSGKLMTTHAGGIF